MAAALDIKAVACTGRGDQGDLDFACVPVRNVLIAFQIPWLIPNLGQVFPDALMVVLIPVRHQHVLAVGLLDQIAQHLQLPVMNDSHLPIGVVESAVGHLQQLSGEDRGIGGIDRLTVHLHQQFLLHGVVQITLGGLHVHIVVDRHALGHIQIVQCLHGDGDVGDFAIDCFLRAGQGDVIVDDAGVGIHDRRSEIRLPVSADEPAEPDALVDQEGLCPQVHQAVAGRGAGESDHPLDLWPDLPQRLPSLALVILERGELVDYHHIEGPGPVQLFQIVHQPFHVFPVDDVDVGRGTQGGLTLLDAAYHHGHMQEIQTVPFEPFFRPDRGTYP